MKNISEHNPHQDPQQKNQQLRNQQQQWKNNSNQENLRHQKWGDPRLQQEILHQWKNLLHWKSLPHQKWRDLQQKYPQYHWKRKNLCQLTNWCQLRNPLHQQKNPHHLRNLPWKNYQKNT